MEESIFQRLTSRSSGSRMLRGLVLSVALGLAAGCAMQMAEGPERAETVFAVAGSNQLVSFNAGRPSSVMKKMPIANLRLGKAYWVSISARRMAGFTLWRARGAYWLSTAPPDRLPSWVPMPLR